MIIHIWMHWFWITSIFHRAFLFYLVTHIITSSVLTPYAGVEAGFLPPAAFQTFPLAFPSQYDDYRPWRERRDVEDADLTSLDTDIDDPTDPTDPASPSVSASPPPPPSSTSYLPDYSASDMDDLYNGGSSDVVLTYPTKKYHTKYSENNPTKYYEKFKAKPSMEDIKVFEGRIDIHVARVGEEDGNGTSTELPPLAGRNETEAKQIDEQMVLNDSPDQVNISTSTEGSDLDWYSTEGDEPDTDGDSDSDVEDTTAEQTTSEPVIFSNKMAAAATSAEERERLHSGALDAGSITGITLAIVVVSGLFGAISFVLYRRRYLNKPQVLNDKSSNLDSSGYIDDTSIRENSEEMYSLDNDSFLNSLEAMTIQNYWTENVKHTKL